MQALRNRGRTLDGRSCELLDKKRIAFRGLYDPSLMIGGAMQQAHRKLAGLRPIERLERQRRVGRKPPTPRGTYEQEVRAGERKQHQLQVSNPRSKHLEQIEHSAFRPLQIFEQEHRRSSARHRLHEASRRLKQDLAVSDFAPGTEANQKLKMGGGLVDRLGRC